MAGVYYNTQPGATLGNTIVATPQPQPQQGIPGWLAPVAGAGVVGGAGLGAGLAYGANGVNPFAAGVPSRADLMAQYPKVGYTSGINPQIGTTAQMQANQWFDQAMAPRANPIPAQTNPLYGPASTPVNIMQDAAQSVGAVPTASTGNFLNSGTLGADRGGLMSANMPTKFGNMGLAIGLPIAGNMVASHLSDPAQANTSRALGNAGGAGVYALPAMGSALGITGIGGPAAAAAAMAGAGLAQGFSATDVGNKTINQMRGQDTGNGLGDYAAAAAQGLFGALPLIGRGAEKLGLINGSTSDTVADVLGGGGTSESKAAPVSTITPEQRLAASSPESLSKLAADYQLSPAMTQKLLKNYNQAMVMAKHNGAVTIKADKDGKIDGIDAKDYPGIKAKTFEDGSQGWVSTNPADIQQAVYEQVSQMVPALGQQQDQEEDYFRKQAVMQAQLEAVLPQVFSGWSSGPELQGYATQALREIPSRYAQAQAQQAQQSYDNQVAQLMMQRQIDAQYPNPNKSSSQQPATLDAAMNPQ